MVPGDHCDSGPSLAQAADLVVLDAAVQCHNPDTALRVEHPWLLSYTHTKWSRAEKGLGKLRSV